MNGLVRASLSAASRLSASMMLYPVIDSMFHGRSLVPLLAISRPPAKPPWSNCTREIASNHAFQASNDLRSGFFKPEVQKHEFLHRSPLVRARCAWAPVTPDVRAQLGRAADHPLQPVVDGATACARPVHRSLYERSDPRFFCGGQLLQREGGRPPALGPRRGALAPSAIVRAPSSRHVPRRRSPAAARPIVRAT
jgi:hypothetical protein